MKVFLKIGSFAKKEDWIVDDLKTVIEQGINDEVTVFATQEIRKTSNPKKHELLKNSMFAFFPCWDATDRHQHVSNGVIQFDLEAKDHDEQTLHQVNAFVKKHPATLYSFRSPRNGLKFALQTDFNENFKSDEDHYKAYYKRAVLQVENLIRTQCCNFINDRAVDSIAQACFLAYDPDYYFCSEVQPLKLNHSAIRQEVASTLQATKGQLASTSFDRLTSDEIKEEVLYYLEGVPTDLQYDKRLPINYTVLYYFGDDGIDILMKHWSHPNREKLKNDLKSQLANVQSPAMNALKAYSAKHNKTKYTDSSFAYAQPSSTTFPDRDPVDVARQKVADAIDDFLANPTDTVIKAPCGIGKSTYMAQRLAALPWNTKVLYLAPTHELAEEVEDKVRNEIISLNRKAGLPRYGSQTVRIQQGNRI